MDFVTDGARSLRLANGSPLMERVTALGCALTGVCGAFLAVEKDAFIATAAAIAVYGVAGEMAAAGAAGPRLVPRRLPRPIGFRHAGGGRGAPEGHRVSVDPRYRICLVTDRGLARGRSQIDIALAAVAGGATMIQLREKDLATRAFIEEARALRDRLAPLGVPLIINDRADVALAVDADGLHVGQDDMPYATARALLGPGKIIGLSITAPDQLDAGDARAADYLGIGPIFAQATKADASPPLGLDGLSAARAPHRPAADGHRRRSRGQCGRPSPRRGRRARRSSRRSSPPTIPAQADARDRGGVRSVSGRAYPPVFA
jgi:thiamine-phosphate diphosphorylase